MTRDIQLLRSVLLSAEDLAPIIFSEVVTGVELDRLLYHVNLLREAGYLEVVDTSTLKNRSVKISGLTWKGHELAGLIRDSERWLTITRRVGSATVSFDLVERLAQQLALQELEIHDVKELTTSN